MSLNAFARMRDANEPAIVAALEAVGASVQKLSERGVPDLLVGWRGRNLLLEVKNPAARGKLTPDQDAWIAGHAGHVKIVRSEEDALAALMIGTSNVGTRAGMFCYCPDDRCDGGDEGCQAVHQHVRGTYPRGKKKR